MKVKSIKRLFTRKSSWAVVYAVYLSLILLSLNAFYAEITVDDIREKMDDSYTYHLTFRKDGVTTHYDVTRHDTSKPGRIQLTYYTQANKLEVSRVENIKTIKIDVNSLFNDESARVFKYNPSEITGMDMDYWLEAGDGIFTVEFKIARSEPIESMTFTKFPPPYSVLVDNEEVWDTDSGINYTIDDNSITIKGIPAGKQTVVIIDWNKKVNKLPIPRFTMDPARDADVNHNITFDGSGSRDPDGEIITWIWDFGDNVTLSGKDRSKTVHAYSKPGTYTVRLTVRDNAVPYGQAWVEKTMNVSYGAGQDTDDDDLPDYWEWANFHDLDETKTGDADGDGYANGLEYLAETDPADDSSHRDDSDSDTLPDLWEWEYFEDLDEGAGDDTDSDGYSNRNELDAGTDPSDATSKPEVPGEDDEGLLGMGTVAGLDVLYIIIIVLVIFTLIMILVLRRIDKEKERERKEAEARDAARASVRRSFERRPPPGPPIIAPVREPAYGPSAGPPAVPPLDLALIKEELGKKYGPSETEVVLEVRAVKGDGTRCLVCGEPVRPGTVNCPVCEAQI